MTDERGSRHKGVLKLEEDGQSDVRIGDFVARVTVKDGRAVVEWRDASGKRVDLGDPAGSRKPKSQNITGELRRFAGYRAEQIERLYLMRQPMRYGDWHERYVGDRSKIWVAGRLIWTFGGVAISEAAADQGVAALPRDGQLIGIDGRPIEEPSSESPVRLWHPLNASVRDVLSWRSFLEALGIAQPFKQTYREIYVLTDAERQAGTASQRFAGHILQMQQFLALCRSRQWKVDYAPWRRQPVYIAVRKLSHWKLRAELRVRFVERHPASADSGYFVTQSVGFVGSRNVPAPLATVPPVAFSEVMRDVDLFVGVSSIGCDPSWQANGTDPIMAAYWQDYSFGKLTEMAQTRRAVLERILPKVKIAERCRLLDRYLFVRGNLRGYRIHLGSANIIMEPNDEYLCIVRDPLGDAFAGKVFLPFEGDATLSTILSKAFMLVDDDRILDPSIKNQILRGLES